MIHCAVNLAQTGVEFKTVFLLIGNRFEICREAYAFAFSLANLSQSKCPGDN